ncbi:MAG: hypothetical protein ACYSWP_21205 [Planctomycetota bacterium]
MEGRTAVEQFGWKRAKISDLLLKVPALPASMIDPRAFFVRLRRSRISWEGPSLGKEYEKTPARGLSHVRSKSE